LRSYDRQMPEELNRVLTDHISDYLFAPTKKAEQNLLREGIDAHSISITGNTVVDALFQSHEISKRSSQVLDTLGLKAGQYILLTAHREENVDSPQRFEGIMSGLALVHDQLDLPIIYPVHPRAEKKVHEFGLDVPSGVEMVATVGFLDFLQLESGARLILTDSGGVQEESCILGVPCITLRENTERPETVEVGSNVLAGTHPESIVEAVKEMLDKRRGWDNPFGDGRAGERIISILEAAL
ncbi:MAG: non-hydrolyzing UDP-N-acetylglucosamine 2-epimerase, partial [Methermicoccaceae archaeon]